MKLSIIIPVYRVAATLDRCLESVVSQSFGDFEVLLVDDGSPDDCPQRCDRWAESDDRISVIHQSNGGLSKARNTGLDAARGDYVTFIDSDDYIAPGTLEAVMADTAESDADMTEYPMSLHHGARHQSQLSFSTRTYGNPGDYWTDTRAYLHTYACNKVFRRTLFDGIRFPEGRVFEDAYTLPRLLKHARRVTTTQRGLYYYCWNPQGITATASGNELRQLLDAHLAAGMPMDDRYYMHLVNIQTDVCELTGDAPKLPCRRVKPVGNVRQKLKAITLNLFGINNLCKISRILHHFKKPSRS